MMNTAVKKNTEGRIMPSTQLSVLCHLIAESELAHKMPAHLIQNTTSQSRYTKPTAWVYENLYNGKPVGMIFSPTTGLTFFLPINKEGEILFTQACYLEKSYSTLTKRMRSGNSILAAELGKTTPIPSGSLAGWIERSLGKAERTIQ